jgi:hypothetical protein
MRHKYEPPCGHKGLAENFSLISLGLSGVSIFPIRPKPQAV